MFKEWYILYLSIVSMNSPCCPPRVRMTFGRMEVNVFR